MQENDSTGLHYHIAICTRLFLIFKPLEEIEDDFEKEYVPYPSWKDNEKLQQEIGIRENYLREFNTRWTLENNTVEIIWGFFNATDMIYGGNKTDCVDSLVIIWATLRTSMRELTHGGYNYFRMLKAFDSFLAIPYNLHTSVYGCYWGTTEIVSDLEAYASTFSRPLTLLFNLVYNGGAVYNSVRNLYLWME